MIDSYWDLYVVYVHSCVEYNKKHDLDPHHYEMEWNHFLPRCIFGDWPIGHYLLLKQHAIASALQTLAFKECCMCGWHKKYIPEALLALCWPYYRLRSTKVIQRVHDVKTEDGKSVQGVRAANHLKRIMHLEKNEEGKSKHAVKAGKVGGARAAQIVHSEKTEDGKSLHTLKLHEEKNKEGKSKHAVKLHEEKNEEGKSVNAVKMGKARALKNQRGVQLIRIKDGEVFIFESLKFAAEVLNIGHENLCGVCKGKRKTVGGYTATYWDG